MGPKECVIIVEMLLTILKIIVFTAKQDVITEFTFSVKFNEGRYSNSVGLSSLSEYILAYALTRLLYQFSIGPLASSTLMAHVKCRFFGFQIFNPKTIHP